MILAFCHFGPFFLLRYWLRAAGFPAAAMVGGWSRDRPAIKRLKDRVSLFPQIPTVFHREDELREAVEFLQAGNPLLVALDVELGKQIEVALDEQWQVRNGDRRDPHGHAARRGIDPLLHHGPRRVAFSNQPRSARFRKEFLLPATREPEAVKQMLDCHVAGISGASGAMRRTRDKSFSPVRAVEQKSIRSC